MNDEYITKAQVIEVAENLRNIAGDAITDAFIKGIKGVEATEVIVNKTDYTGKCGTCQWFERDGELRKGQCQKRAFNVQMGRIGCKRYLAKPPKEE